MKVQNKELHDLYLSSDIIRVVIKSRSEMGWSYPRMLEKRCACRDLLGKSEGERQLGRRRRRLGDNIKIVFKKWYWDCGQD